MTQKTPSNLHIAFTSYAAAKHACTKWHYSKSVPAGKLVIVGVWECGEFIGVVLFGRGANNNLSGAYGLKQTEACELVRIALADHVAPVSRIVRLALNVLKKSNNKMQLVISYADPQQGHHGGVYQAGNWTYVGQSQAQRELLVNGEFMHKRVASSKWGTASPYKIMKMTRLTVEYGPVEWKHTYLMPLNKEMKSKIKTLAKPYPKRDKQAMAVTSGTAEGQHLPSRSSQNEARHCE